MSGPRLSIIPAGAVTDRSLEPRDLQVLCLLGRHTDKDSGWCRRSQVKMAIELDCGRASVQRSLERLVAAGWVQKKRPPWGNAEGQPSNSYMYRVVLDRDDEPMQPVEEDDSTDDPSHAENATETPDCPPMGSDSDHTPGHPGAHLDGHGVPNMVGTKNVSLERPPIERERDARARDRKARFLVSFEARWPTSAADHRQRTAYAAEALTEDEEEPALAGIAPFLADLKRHHRSRVPAGWRYLEEKRWTLLIQKQTSGSVQVCNYAPGSAEALAIIALHDLVGRSEAIRKIWRKPDGSIAFSRPVTPQLTALAQVPAHDLWTALDRAQAAAWERFAKQFFEDGTVRKHFTEGSRAPWPWPPSAEGKIYTTGPPETYMTDNDYAELK